jgi:ABC-2 type transport system permease protein
MTAAVQAAGSSAATRARTAPRAPLTRLLRAELRWVFARRRSQIGLGLIALVPVVIGTGIAIAGRPGSGAALGPGFFAALSGNGFLLPVLAMFVSMPLLLPLVGAMSAADALAGEASTGTLRALLIAPVGRLRLLGVKAVGVAAVTLAAAAVLGVVGMVAGPLLLGGHGMATLSGDELSLLDGIGRVLLAVAWVTVQMWAVAAIGLAISACTEHPLIVMAATLAGVIVSGVLETIPSLDWLHPYLLPDGWGALVDVTRFPLPTDNLLTSTLRAGCYVLIGLSLATARVATKDA